MKPLNGWTKESMIKAIQEGNLGYQSASNVGDCMYRGQHGNKCAIGCFIPDELYTREIEFFGLETLSKKHPKILEHLPVDVPRGRELQNIHDSCKGDPRPKLIEWINKNIS